MNLRHKLIVQLRNILSLNERFAYNLIGKLRGLLLPVFNNFLKTQERRVQKLVIENISTLKAELIKILPTVDKEDLMNVLSSERRNTIISTANKALTHEFEVLSTVVKFNDNIDWHIDNLSGYRWPKGKLYSHYNQVDETNNADVKFPRELSRCHHFLYLGEAYLLTGEEKYTEEFIAEITHWIVENPYKKSINWGCSMDIAIRASNWIYSLRMFEKSSLINDDFYKKIMTSLYLHARYIYENPEKNRVYNHNHYLSDLAGQILCGMLFKPIGNDEVKHWTKHGVYEFFREVRVQILPSGFTYERTTNYHRLVTELIAYTFILLKNNHVEIPLDITYRIKKMFEATLNYLFSDGTAPIIGDQDNGRFLPFYPYNINFQGYLLNIATILFEEDKFKNYSHRNHIDGLFLFGKKAIKKNQTSKPKQKELVSKSFPDVGFYIMRTQSVFVFINNSGLSHYNEEIGSTHTHSDLLSFVYAANGIPFLIDPGTYVYSSNTTERMKFRSTAMHNTLTVDDFNQNNLKETSIWSIERNAIPSELNWTSDKETDIFEGSHSGYERLEAPLKHTRRFELDKKTGVLKILDKLESKAKYIIKCHLHFDENVEVKILDKNILCNKNSENIKIYFQANLNYEVELKEDFISKSYNSKILAPYVCVSFEIDKSSEFMTIIETDSNYA